MEKTYLLTAGQELEKSFSFCSIAAFPWWSFAALCAERSLSLRQTHSLMWIAKQMGKEFSGRKVQTKGLLLKKFLQLLIQFWDMNLQRVGVVRWTGRWVWWGGLREELGFSLNDELLKNIWCWPNKVILRADSRTPRTSTGRTNSHLSPQWEKWNSYSELSVGESSHRVYRDSIASTRPLSASFILLWWKHKISLYFRLNKTYLSLITIATGLNEELAKLLGRT